jgi:hypothetical protein
MQHIHVSEGLRLRFPGRGQDFDAGVETGIAAHLMALSRATFVQTISAENLEQLRELASAMQYRLVVLGRDAEWAEVEFNQTRVRPRLSIIRNAKSVHRQHG